MDRIKLNLWRHIKPFQWRALWLAHDKFIIGVTGVILDNEKNVLLLRHTYWPEGSWGLPSGYAEHGEKLEDTLTREVKEETGYEIEVEKLLQLTSGYQLRLEVAYLGKLKGGELRIAPKEVMEAKFFPLDETPESLLESHKILIEEVRNSLKEKSVNNGSYKRKQ